MPSYTIEKQYLAPVYVQETVEADSPEEAMQKAFSSENWEGSRLDIENGRGHEITGCWAGSEAHIGESAEIPSRFKSSQGEHDGTAKALS